MSEEKQQSNNGADAFRSELLSCWRQLPDKGLFFGLVVIWCALFQFRGNAVFGWVDTPSLFRWMYWAYATWPDDGHGFLVPFVVLALFWWKRKELLAAPQSTWWPALSLVVLGLILHILAYMVQQTQISIVGFFTGLYGITGVVWGRHWLRASFFPMVLFVFCVPLGSMADGITFPLRIFVTKFSVGFANTILGIPVVRDGSRILDEGLRPLWDVAAACSGLRSLISLLALTTIYGFVTFRAAWKRILMIFAAIPLAVLGNIVRIIGVIITGDAFGHTAGAFVEQKLGFVTFAVAIAGLLMLGHVLRDQETNRRAAV